MPRRRRYALFVLLFALAVAVPSAWAADPLTPDQVQQVERVIREYLLKHPELLIEMSNTLRAQQEKAKTAQFQKMIAASQKDLVSDPNSFVAGNPSGDVTIVEFFDYQCGYCRRVHPTLATLLQRDGGVRLVLKELPILGPGSEIAARAAIASMAQPGKYYAFHTALMANQNALDEPAVLAIAARVGLDAGRLRTDMQAPRIGEVISANRKLATTLGIDGTPAFVIGDRLVPGAVRRREPARRQAPGQPVNSLWISVQGGLRRLGRRTIPRTRATALR
jgi:protein-disulfide isomerase